MRQIGLALVGLTLAAACYAQEAAKPAVLTPAQSADAKALLELVGEFTRAFNAHEAKTIAATFTDDAEIEDEAGLTEGRAAIEAKFQDYFDAGAGSKIEIHPSSLRFVSPDVVIEKGYAIVKPAETIKAPEKTQYTVTYIRQNGKWLQSSLRDHPGDEPAIPDRLKELEWLVGDWVTESEQAIVATSVKWTEDRHFLLRDFTVTIAGKPAVKGVQRIGWDASRKQIRSWLFDSKGGFGEGYWTRSGEQWMIKSTGVNHEGDTASATQLLTRMGRDHIRWSAFDRTNGDTVVPDLDEITLVRKPPQPGAK